MNPNIIFFDDDLNYLAGQYSYGLSFLRSSFRGENVKALLLTEAGNHLPRPIRESCGIEERSCSVDPVGLKTILDSYASEEPDSIHIVYLPCDEPVYKAIQQHNLAEVCSNYTIVVVDWEYGDLIRGNDIRAELENSGNLLIACSAAKKYGSMMEDLNTETKWFASCQKADPNASREDKIHAILVRALSTVRRNGKSRQLLHCLGDTNNPLGAYLHPGRTWESEFQGNVARFSENISHAREYFNLNLRDLLEPEERREFDAPTSNWSFQAIRTIIDSIAPSEAKASLEELLGVGLKGRFRADFEDMLLTCAGNNVQLRNAVQHLKDKLPAAWDPYVYVPTLTELFSLISRPAALEVTKTSTADSWTKHTISIMQHGRNKGGASEDNKLLTWTQSEIIAAISGSRKKSDFERICRIVSTYGPLLFERYNKELADDKYVAVRREGRRTTCLTEDEIKMDFERLPLHPGHQHMSDPLLRFSFVLWMPTALGEAKPSDEVPDDL